MTRAIRLLVLVLAVAAAAAAVNLVLLGYVGDRNDPVGKLKPVAPGLVTHPVPAPPRQSRGEASDD